MHHIRMMKDLNPKLSFFDQLQVSLAQKKKTNASMQNLSYGSSLKEKGKLKLDKYGINGEPDDGKLSSPVRERVSVAFASQQGADI